MPHIREELIMQEYYAGVDFDDFWEAEASGEQLTEAMVAEAENTLGYKLPKSYVALLATQNGGRLQKRIFPTNMPNSWAEDHVAVLEICGIGGKYDLLGVDGSEQYIQKLGYPAIGVVIGHTPSSSHDTIMLDYRTSGITGEPRVVHVDIHTADKPIITPLAVDFETFLLGLIDEDEWYEDEDYAEDEYEDYEDE